MHNQVFTGRRLRDSPDRDYAKTSLYCTQLRLIVMTQYVLKQACGAQGAPLLHVRHCRI